MCQKKDDFNLLIVNSQKISIDKMQAACKQGRILSCMLQIFVHLVCLTKGSLSRAMLSVTEERSGGTADSPSICLFVSRVRVRCGASAPLSSFCLTIVTAFAEFPNCRELPLYHMKHFRSQTRRQNCEN